MKHKIVIKRAALGLLAGAVLFSGCRKRPAQTASSAAVSTPQGMAESTSESVQESMSGSKAESMPESMESQPAEVNIPDDKYRTTYEVFVYSFYDSDGDGIGDLKGVQEKLDYIGTELGATGIWLMPICPSPTYHKYDMTDYKAIDEQYGTMEDFKALLDDCHGRGIDVIIDMPFNHSSVEHPWFKAAAEYLNSLPDGAKIDTGACPYADYYNFSREWHDGYEQLPGGKWYYEARFWSGMPDLNLDSEAVKNEISDIMKFWLEVGVDGFRLDAVTSYYTESSSSSIAFLSWLKERAGQIKSGLTNGAEDDVYFVGECWSSQQVYAGYYDSGIDSFFDFAFSGEDGMIARTVRSGSGGEAFAKAMAAEEALYGKHNMDYVNAPFYTNHDMARSTGYYAYDDGSKTKLAGALNLLMTGNAFVYYGEELGMKGSGKDENKRAAMYWSADGTQPGMCAGPKDMDKVEMKFPACDEQAADPYSILNYYRKAIGLRNTYPVIARGRTKVMTGISNDSICAFVRSMKTGQGADEAEYEPVLVVINVSEESKTVSLGAVRGGYYNLADVLTVSEEEVKLEGTSLTLPARGIAVLTR